MQVSLRLWSQMEKCAFPDTKPPVQAFGQKIVQVVTEEEQWWQILCPLLNLVWSYCNHRLFAVLMITVITPQNYLFCPLSRSDLDFSGSSNHVWCSLYAMFFGFSNKWLWWLGKGKSYVVNCLFCCVFWCDCIATCCLLNYVVNDFWKCHPWF